MIYFPCWTLIADRVRGAASPMAKSDGHFHTKLPRIHACALCILTCGRQTDNNYPVDSRQEMAGTALIPDHMKWACHIALITSYAIYSR